MRRRRVFPLFGVLLLAPFFLGCGGDTPPPKVTVSVIPAAASLFVNATQQFSASVAGTTDPSVTWFVNDIEGGNSTVGTISTAGLYVAPASVPSPNTVTVKAVSKADPTANGTAAVTLDSGVRISLTPSTATVGTNETFQFFATVTGTSNTDVNWLVNDVAGGNSTAGTITSTGLYTAPASVPSPASVTVKAVAVADTTRSITASVTVAVAVDPTLTFISPTITAQGSLFQDVYVTGTNFISTTVVQANGTPVPATQLSSVFIRARIPDTMLVSPGTLTVAVQRQNGPLSATQDLTVVPARPALVGASPDSGTQGGPAFSFNVNGGYFGAPSLPTVTAEFDGVTRAASVTNSRQLNVTIGPSDLSTPGLFSLAVRNSAAAPPVAVTNLAVQPSASSIPSAPIVRLTVGTKPSAVAINTATGIAVVANHDSNDITLIDLTAGTPAVIAASIVVGNSPTGVAVDNLRNLAIVVNNADKSLSVVDLGTQTVTATVSLGSISSAAPVSVGVNPLTGRGLVAHQSTNAATLLDLTTNPPSVIGTVTASTGLNPQVAVEPRLNWALVTPGGAGTLSIVDLGRQSVNSIASNGAVRSANVVTITTTTAHGLAVGQPVLIRGVADTGFNGTFTLLSVPSSTTFTYSQTAADASSGGGTANYASALATLTVGSNVTGVSISPETEKALLTDPSFPSATLLSVLNQTVGLLTLEAGHMASAVNQLTDIGVTVNPSTDEVSVIDPRTPARLARISLGAGSDPKAVAIDPGSNLVVVANEGTNDVAILSLGSIRSLHITEISPLATLSSSSDLPMTVLGKGFVSGSVVRLDGAALPAGNVTFVSERRLDVTIPASLLGGPRRYALDVLNPGGVLSNAVSFAVIQAVDVTGTGCSAPAPRAVAIDPQRNLAVVTNPGCNNISVIDLATGTVSRTVSVGTNPQGVAVDLRVGKAVVSNRGSNNASVVNLSDGTVTATVATGAEPLGVAINPNNGNAFVADSGSGSVTVFHADSGGLLTTVPVEQRPVAVAIDPVQNLGMVVNAGANSVSIVNLGGSSPTVASRLSGFQLPTAVVSDPVSGLFVVAASLANNLALVNPATLQVTSARIGINPTAMAYNFQSATLVTLNTASGTASVMDFIDGRVRVVLGSDLVPQCQNPILVGTPPLQQQQQPPCGVDIHPLTNLAVMADGDRNRVLLVPLPR